MPAYRELIANSAAPQVVAVSDEDKADLLTGDDLDHLEHWAEGLVYMDAQARRAPRRMRHYE